ncbi:AAA family ATPase [uncultured Methanobrevibacter sp.]|uniref:AAA family ATPase n=1 Tax=uncultured Methanobrevibacter sp. TaxID=253161 RepID=UPI002616688C|nr:AAA family ATPase [uncultured Methanobrevibacter sp.]
MKTNNKNLETKPINSKSKNIPSENTKFAECVVLKPVGYPFDFAMMENTLEINNKTLFEEYAREQWLGLVVKENSYLFDQKIIPDYGFQIISVEPNNSIISENTNIKLVDLEIGNLDTVKRVKTNVKISDIIGQENAKNKIKVLIKYLKEPEKFGMWAPKNILFYGLPGTGKTMLVKALANELDVPLYLIKATSLIGEHVGDGASKIQELFEKAQKTSPSIIFIDEIDAIALPRSFQSLRGDVAEIVNSLLTEMDGINDNQSVITIGATNTPNSIDYAVRSRFEEEIEFILPNDNERKEIFENNLKTYPLNYNLDLEKLVKLSKNMSGRDIKEKILKTALHHAISQDKEIVDMKDVEYSLKASKIKNNEVKGMFE